MQSMGFDLVILDASVTLLLHSVCLLLKVFMSQRFIIIELKNQK